MRKTRRLALFSMVTGATIALDQITKAWARTALSHRPVTLLGGMVRLAHSENVGAFMGLGAGLPPALRTLIFSVFAGVILIGVAVYTFTSRDLAPVGVVATSLLVAGGLGNLIDRVTREGAVTDFLNVGLGPVRTGVFNVADLAIVVGSVCLILFSWRGAPHPEESPDAAG